MPLGFPNFRHDPSRAPAFPSSSSKPEKVPSPPPPRYQDSPRSSMQGEKKDREPPLYERYRDDLPAGRKEKHGGKEER
ncbi:MAG: hypothetical protein M1830_001153 [Pleopsidium flavum]|nr:MAG: hypothetical protein M1830_001153 [Pleopsidium flavum]